MKKSVFAAVLIGGLMAGAGLAQAGEYSCKVYCVGPSGTTTVTVRASSASEAASIVDKQGHQVCQAAGHQGASTQTMGTSQCR